MAARGRKRKNVSSSEEEEDESSLSSEESEEEEEESEDDDDEEEEEELVRPRGRGKTAPIARKKTPAKKPAAKAPAKKRGRPAKQQQEVQEEEEELLDASATQTLANEEEENDPGFDSSLFKDEADKAYLSSLPEVERERVLAERYDRWQRYEEWKRLRAERAGSGAAQSASSRRVVSQQQKSNLVIDSDEEDDSRRKTKKSSAAVQVSQRSESDEESGDDEVVSSEGDVIPRGKRGDSDDEMDDLDDEGDLDFASTNRIILSRKQILEWMDYPRSRFSGGLVGCLVKVLLDEKTERYGIRQITRVVMEDVQPYTVDREGVLFMLKLKGGPRNKTIKCSLAKVSNKPLSQEEFTVFMRENPLKDLQKREARYVYEHLKETLIEYTLTPKDVLRMVESRKMRQGDDSFASKFVGLTTVGKKHAISQEIAECNRQRARLAKALEQLESSKPKRAGADDDDDEDNESDDETKQEKIITILKELREVNQNLTKLEQEQRKVEAIITKHAEKTSGAEVGYKLNERNEQRNRMTLIKVEEKMRALHASAMNSTGSVPTNPFLRRPTRPTMMWATDLNSDGTKPAGESADGNSGQTTTTTTTTGTTSTNAPSIAEGTTMGSGEAGVEFGKDETPSQGVNSFDILDAKPQQVKLKMQPDATIAVSTATKKFSLEEYRRMKQQQGK